MHYSLIITQNAEKLLDNILNYILHKLHNPQAAGGLIAAIDVVYSNVENNPKMYAYVEDAFLKASGYRKAVIPNYDYVIIYRIDEENKIIYVMGYFHDLELYRNKL